MSDAPRQHLDRFGQWLAGFPSALIAYSGGVDSAVVMAAAHRFLGERAVACIGVSPSYPRRELDAAVALVERLGVPHRLVHTHEHLDPNYAANPVNRCYFCKTELYDRLAVLAREERWAVILDGNNASDLGDDRPGRAAAAEHAVRSPLAELGLSKNDVRALARHLGLDEVWDKPAMACLSSRVPHGTAITPQLLARIEQSEDVLARLGFRQFRVRHHGDLARIELEPHDFALALQHRDAIVQGLRAAGYRTVCLDLAGFRGGTPGPVDPRAVHLTVSTPGEPST